MKKNVLQEKSYAFALKIVKTVTDSVNESRGNILLDQLLRSGTSIGANMEEAIGALSQKDFLFKLTIAYKEARETRFWLRLLRDSGILQNSEFLISDCEELLRIIGSIQKTMKDKMGITGVAETAEFFYESENIKGI